MPQSPRGAATHSKHHGLQNNTGGFGTDCAIHSLGAFDDRTVRRGMKTVIALIDEMDRRSAVQVAELSRLTAAPSRPQLSKLCRW